MSETAPERPARGGNFLTRKVGPLPAWGWAALAAAGAGVYFWYRNRQGQAAAAAPSAAGTPTGAQGTSGATDQAASIATLQDEIQQIQGELSKDAKEDKGSGGGKGKPKYARHVSTGKETFLQIAKAQSTTIGDIIAVSKRAPESDKNVAELEAWARHPHTRRAGVVYYTAA